MIQLNIFNNYYMYMIYNKNKTYKKICKILLIKIYNIKKHKIYIMKIYIMKI